MLTKEQQLKRKHYPFFYKKGVQKTWFFILLFIPFLLWIMPSTFFDNDSFSICPSKLFFNVECFGCGMTRAIMHLHHFDLSSALYYNYGSIIVYPVLIIIWFWWLIAAAKNIEYLPFKKVFSNQ